MSNTDLKRYGLIGAGTMGQDHIRSLAHVSGAGLVAVTETDDNQINGTLAALKTSSFSPSVFSDWREMVGQADLDALLIATPNHTHFEILSTVLDSKLAILVDQPLCTTLKDGETVAKRARKRKALTQIGLDYRFMPPIARLLERVHAGDIGPAHMVSIRAHCGPTGSLLGTGRRENTNTGGVLVAHCSQFFDLMRMCFQDEPVRIYASAGQNVNGANRKTSDKTVGVADNALVIVDFKGGSRASLDFCMFAEGSEVSEAISVVGETGKLDVALPSGILTHSPRDGSGPLYEQVTVEESLSGSEQLHSAAIYHLRAFHDAMIKGDGATLTAQDGMKAVAMGLAAQDSVAKGRPVKLSFKR